MTEIMTNEQFIAKAQLAADTPSCYVTGCLGAPLDMPGVVDRWEQEYPKNLKYDTLIRTRAALAVQQGTHCFGFDCVNLIKVIINGWCADGSQEYGGSIYEKYCPDVTIDALYDYCTDKNTDFTNILPGAMLVMNNGGHCGIYIGSGYAIEATGSWERKIYVTAVANLLDRYPEIANYEKKRTWQKWGLLPWIKYQKDVPTMSLSGKIICPCCGKMLNAGIELTLAAAQTEIEYTVQTGDTPYGIARKFYGDGSKYTKIMLYNGLPVNDPIHTGQILKIPLE